MARVLSGERPAKIGPEFSAPSSFLETFLFEEDRAMIATDRAPTRVKNWSRRATDAMRTRARNNKKKIIERRDRRDTRSCDVETARTQQSKR